MIMETFEDYDVQEQEEVPVVGKYLDLRVDWAFKYVFSKKEILLKLLNDILPPTITDLEYLEPRTYEGHLKNDMFDDLRVKVVFENEKDLRYFYLYFWDECFFYSFLIFGRCGIMTKVGIKFMLKVFSFLINFF